MSMCIGESQGRLVQRTELWYLSLVGVQDPVMKQKDMPPKQYVDRKNKGEKVAQCQVDLRTKVVTPQPPLVES